MKWLKNIENIANIRPVLVRFAKAKIRTIALKQSSVITAMVWYGVIHVKKRFLFQE